MLNSMVMTVNTLTSLINSINIRLQLYDTAYTRPRERLKNSLGNEEENIIIVQCDLMLL